MSKPATKAKTDDDETLEDNATPPGLLRQIVDLLRAMVAFQAGNRTPCDVKMTTDFEIGGGSFNRLTKTLNQSEIDDATGIIYFNFKGQKRRISIHSSAVGALTEV